MQEYLIFTLYGPLASWGGIAVGEYRPSLSHPTKSAVLGIIAAAMGIDRYDDENHISLDSNIYLGLKVHSIGELLRDYHTIQVPASKKTHGTRKSEMSDEKIETILSQRDYRCDAFSSAAILLKANKNFTLQSIAEKLQQPVYMPYLGRKSCTPALPFDPQIVKSDDLKTAFSLHEKDSRIPEGLKGTLNGLGKKNLSTLYWEAGIEPGISNFARIVMKDRVLSRKNWQFRDRVVYYGGAA